MTHPIGSFFPLVDEDAESPAVLFAFTADTPQQRRALHDEVVSRLSAVRSLSNALLAMQVEDHDRRSHARVMEAIAILSRDVLGLVHATEQSAA